MSQLRIKLSGIEALRGVAATAVVLSHAARHVDKAVGSPRLITAFQAGHAGVDLFFVISGFIILFVHRGDVGEGGRLPRYLRRRFTRVFPLYWVALGITLSMSFAGGHGPPAPGLLLTSAFLLPTLNEPILGIAWTLQFEIVFYAMFAVLIVHRGVGLVLFAAWLAWIGVTAAGFGAAGIPSALCGIYGVEFFLGMAAARLVQGGRIPVPGLVAGLGAALFAAAFVAESAGFLDGFGAAARFAYGVPAALLVAGIGAAEQAGRLAVPGWLRMLGGASYSIYLFQFVLIGVLWQGLLAAGLGYRLPDVVLFALLSGTALAGGIVVARTVEQPLLRAMRGRTREVVPQQV